MSFFRDLRNIELSTLYYISQSVATDWPDTTVLKTFKEVYAKNISLPIICVRLASSNHVQKEVGDRAIIKYPLIIIDIFASSDGYRLDLADYLIDKLRLGWVHYTHSHPSGSNATLERVADGRDSVEEFIRDERIDFGETVDEKDKFRHQIAIRVRKSS